MLAQRFACQTPWGEVHDLVVVEGRVVVPGELAALRALWWLGAERHPRLAVTALSALERATGAALGLAPYCVAVERWNQAARDEVILPVVPPCREATSTAFEAAGVALRPASLVLPEGITRPPDASRGVHGPQDTVPDRVHAGRDAVSSLLEVLRRPARWVLHGAAIAACAYYMVTAASWLFALRDGMTGADLQSGLLVLLVGFLLSGFTRALWNRAPNDRVDAAAVRRVQPIVETTLGAYRLGIVLQLLAFAAFSMM